MSCADFPSNRIETFPFELIGRATSVDLHCLTRPWPQTPLEPLMCSTLAIPKLFLPLDQGKGLFVQTPVDAQNMGIEAASHKPRV